MSQVKRFLPSFGIAVIILYFGYHVLRGDQSILHWANNQQQESILRERLGELHKARDRLEQQNRMLRNSSLDLDYLSERAQAKLQYMEPNDLIVYSD